MITIERITPARATLHKSVRLRALQDSPGAFGSTYAKESQLSDADWIRRATDFAGEKATGYLAMDDGAASGIIGAFLKQDDPTRAQIISMWVTPTHRRRGVGQLLVDAVDAWVRSRGVATLILMVTDHNASAIKFYESLGFTMTGRTEMHVNDPAVMELEMSRRV